MIIKRVDGPIGTIILNNDIKRNVLSEALVEQLIDTINEFVSAEIRCIVLRAQPGVKVWSAGHNVTELPEGGSDPLGWQDPLRKLIREIENCPAPIVAMIEGTVWGGGCETVFACDIVIATPESTFAATPAKHGVPYNISGLLTFLNAANIHVAKEMLFTAAPMSAQRLESLGVINHVVPLEELEEFTYSLARSIVQNAPLSIAVMKEQMRILAGAHSMSPQGFERIQGLRRVVYNSVDYAEGIRAFKEKRKPKFCGK